MAFLDFEVSQELYKFGEEYLDVEGYCAVPVDVFENSFEDVVIDWLQSEDYISVDEDCVLIHSKPDFYQPTVSFTEFSTRIFWGE